MMKGFNEVMKKGFTLVEVSILFVVFLIVAFLVAPLSLDDTIQAKHTSKWRSVQEDFTNIFYSIDTQKEQNQISFQDAFNSILKNEIKEEIKSYKITFLNGALPIEPYRFKDYKLTYSNAVIAIKLFENEKDKLKGILLYDVNGASSPNTWGKDVFGLNIYEDKFEPIGKDKPFSVQKQDCSKNGTGLSCSNFYLIGGSFD